MRALISAALLIAAVVPANASAQPAYRVIGQLLAGDGGWDLASVDSERQRLYVARTDGVTAIDLKTGTATDRFVAGQRVHAALVIPGTPYVISTNGQANNASCSKANPAKSSRPFRPVRSRTLPLMIP